jgi:hypothetical protein
MHLRVGGGPGVEIGICDCPEEKGTSSRNSTSVEKHKEADLSQSDDSAESGEFNTDLFERAAKTKRDPEDSDDLEAGRRRFGQRTFVTRSY